MNSSVLSKSNGASSLARPSGQAQDEAPTTVVSSGPVLAGRPVPTTIEQLIEVLQVREAKEHPDLVLPMKSLRFTAAFLLEVPGRGALALTEWSRGQLASELGLRWSKWTENADSADVAEEVNRRLKRAAGEVRVRSSATPGDTPGAEGTLRALVAPGYTPVSDATVAASLAEALAPTGKPLRVRRLDLTDRTTSFQITLGESFRPGGDAKVGDVQGGILVRNSGVGFSAFSVHLSLLRLICLNGMTVPESGQARRAHRGLDEARVRSLITQVLGGFDERMMAAATALRASVDRLLSVSVDEEIRRLLDEAKLPKRLAEPIIDAYGEEPDRSAFGVSQAFTLAAQQQAPEVRYELERLAGRYIQAV